MIALKSYMPLWKNYSLSVVRQQGAEKSIIRDRRCAIASEVFLLFWNRHGICSRSTYGMVKKKRTYREWVAPHLHFNVKSTWSDWTLIWQMEMWASAITSSGFPRTNPSATSSTCWLSTTMADNDMQIWGRIVFRLCAADPNHSNMIINNVMFIHIKLELYTQRTRWLFFVWLASRWVALASASTSKNDTPSNHFACYIIFHRPREPYRIFIYEKQ